MVPQQKTETIECTYWTCEVEKHRHRSEEAALYCISRSNPKPRHCNVWTPAKKIDLAARRRRGDSLRFLAQEFRVSPEQIRRVVAMGDRLLRIKLWKMAHLEITDEFVDNFLREHQNDPVDEKMLERIKEKFLQKIGETDGQKNIGETGGESKEAGEGNAREDATAAG